MNDLFVLTWALKIDPNQEMHVFGTCTECGMKSLRMLARSLHKIESCDFIRITNVKNVLIEDWGAGYKKTPTDLYNEGEDNGFCTTEA